ncbi:CYP4V2 [Cordylochernes scorpioides]|uniref:CYP4V2 n=1 Tax=Cordylochernes scorpioides TaxID=51811 RepID=A0ABY6LE81_9ARAC|nr:CYP4V2 [Cordylochernes scorpioides]
MGKIMRTGKVVIVLNGKYAGKKAIIVKNNAESNSETPYGHDALVAGVDRSPRKIAKKMNKKKQAKKSRIKGVQLQPPPPHPLHRGCPPGQDPSEQGKRQGPRKVILERREEFKKLLSEGKTPTNPEEEFITRRRRAFLDMLLYYHLVEGSMGLEEVKEEVDNFMFTGHDSAALTTSWVIYFLGLYQNIQSRVMEELEEIYGENSDSDVTIEDTKKMEYLGCVMKESLRIYTGIPYIARHLTEDLKIGR